MDNMKCQVQNHDGKKIIAICMDKECKIEQRLCCILCLIESHNNHQKKWVEIGEINTYIDQESKKQIKYPETCSYGQIQIIQGLEKLNTLIDNLQKIILQTIELIKQSNLQDYLKKTMSSQQGQEYWNQLLEGILQYSQVDNCLINKAISKEGELNKLDECYIQIIRQSEEQLQSMTNQINKNQMKIDGVAQTRVEPTQIQELDKQIQMENNKPIQQKIDQESQTIADQSSIKLDKETQMQITTLIQIDQGLQTIIDNPIKIGKLRFDHNRTNKDIVIIDQHTIKKTQTTSWAMAYTDCGFDPSTQSLKFTFNIQNFSNYIFVGVGNDEGNIVPSYILPSYGVMNHGQYMISSDGFTFHHTNAEINYKSGISFGTGDRIHIKYDHLTKILEFRKESDQNKIITMPITDMTKQLYPFVILYQANSQVQLIEF